MELIITVRAAIKVKMRKNDDDDDEDLRVDCEAIFLDVTN